MSARSKLTRVQRLIRERGRKERCVAELTAEVRRLRREIKTLDAAIAVEADPAADAFFSALEQRAERPAIAGRIGAA